MTRDEALARIESFRALEDNWDSYGTPAFDPAFLVDVHAAVGSLADDDFTSLHISPFPGGVQLEWNAGPLYLEIGLHEDESLSWIAGHEDGSLSWIAGHEGDDSLDRDGWATDWLAFPEIVAAWRPREITV